MDTNLVFGQPPINDPPIGLVFGGDTPGPAADATVTLKGQLPKLGGVVPLALAKPISLVATLPGLSGSIPVAYASDTSRPLVNETDMRWQEAKGRESSWDVRWQATRRLPAGWVSRWQDAQPLSQEVRTRWSDTNRLSRETDVRFQEAIRLATAPIGFLYEEAIRLRTGARVRFQEALRTALPPVGIRYQDGLRDRRNWAAVRFQQGVPVSSGIRTGEQRGQPLAREWGVRYQKAMRPPAGVWVRPTNPQPEDPCYTPPLGDLVHLVFSDPSSEDTNLFFICEKHGPGPQPGETIVVPIREVYLVINSAVLIRVDNGKAIPTLAMSMSLDVDSWTWSFNATVPAAAQGDLEPSDNGPVDVQATINGVAYRFLVESMGRERAFNQVSLRVSGRGRAAVLDAPYAPGMSFFNNSNRTAQQLLADILTENGVPLGWDVDWGLTDWLVPAGMFSHQGSYISAMNQVVGAAGGYLQPHPTDEVFRVLPRYPSAPWKWGDVTPDFQLPVAVATREGIDWANKPRYNRVFVSGQQQGVLGRVTRAGTAGDLLAQTVVDPLITHADAARQRGTSILSDTGRIASVTLRLPVLPETGIIPPGKFIDYVDGGITRRGLSRSVQVEVGLPTVWQTIGVETHVEPV